MTVQIIVRLHRGQAGGGAASGGALGLRENRDVLNDHERCFLPVQCHGSRERNGFGVGIRVQKYESTADNPSALRNAVAGLKPRIVLSESPPPDAGLPGIRVVKLVALLTMPEEPPASARTAQRRCRAPRARWLNRQSLTLDECCGPDVMVPEVMPFPKLTCWAAKVPVQSTPFAEVTSFVVSTILASDEHLTRGSVQFCDQCLGSSHFFFGGADNQLACAAVRNDGTTF